MRKLLLLFIFLFVAGWGYGQTTIAFQGFESSGDTWTISTGSGNISSLSGSSDHPSNSRIRTGSRSWQVINTTGTLELSSVDISSYNSVKIIVHVSSTAGTSGNGADAADYVKIYANVNNSGYPSTADIELDGKSNAKWDYNATLTETTQAGTPVTIAAPQGGTSTNNYATLEIAIPDGSTSVSFKLSAKNNSSNERWNIDDISLTGTASTGVNDPTNFAATTASTTQINLSWTQNTNNNDVMVAWSSNGTFGTPTNGTTYTAGSAISGGGTVLYNGSATTYNHTSLTSGTQYYYKAWSVDGSTNYSIGTSANASTYKAEPTNHVASFTAGTPTSSSIPLTWADNDGIVAADSYLIMINTTGTFTPPVDGTAQANDLNVSNGSGVVNVTHGVQTYTWTNLTQGTHYYFKIYPYTNSGSAINYKTNGTVPTANAITGIPAAEPVVGDLKISEVNSTSAAYASYAEIYNTTNSELSLDNVDLEFYSDGSATATSTLHLTGSINANSYIVIARKSADFNTAYGFTPNFAFLGMSINGGADGLILRHNNNTILDQFNAAPNGTVDMTDNNLYYRFDYSSNGSSLANDWDDSGRNKNGTPRAANQLTWKTSGTADWHTGSNWSNGDVPSKGVDVIIPSGGTQPSVSGTVANPASCKNLTINSNAVLTIPVTEYMTVYGNLTNNNGSAAGLVVQSNGTGNGSLIVDGTISGNATVQRYMAKFSSVGAANGWHEIGCPVSSYSVSGTDWDPKHTGTNDDLYYWDEAQNSWMNYRTSAFNFSAGNGYLAANDNNLTHVFTGVLNNTDVTISGLSYTSGQGNGWHLLGNPFPSAIKWNDGNWTLTNVGAVAEIWNGTHASYTTISANGIIPSTDGFFVEVSSGNTGSVTIPVAARVHNATNNQKAAPVVNQKETLTFKITDDTNTYSDVSILGFRPEATKNWDIAFDAHKILSFVKESPQIWTTSDDQKFLVNYLPEITSSSYDVPLHFRAGANTVYHLTIKGADSFENTSLILEDLQTGQKIDLSHVTSYDFTADKGDDTNRFVLHINGVTAVPNVSETGDIQVFTFGNTVYLHGQQNLNGRVSIFNTLGQEIFTGSLNRRRSQKISLNQKTGIYFVRVKDGNKVITRKVFIK